MGKALVSPMGSSGGGIEWTLLGERVISGENPSASAGFVDATDFDFVRILIAGEVKFTMVSEAGYSPSLILFCGGSSYSTAILSLGGNVGETVKFDASCVLSKGCTQVGPGGKEVQFSNGGVSANGLNLSKLSVQSGLRTGYLCNYVQRIWGGKFKF